MKRFGKTLLAAFAAGAAMAAPHAQAALGDLLFAVGGPIDIRFEGSDARFDSTVSVNGSDPIFPNHGTAVGTTVTLGDFAAGAPIDVMLQVLNTGLTFHTGPGSANPDGLAHAEITAQGGRTFVSFEDLAGGGDGDFNDHMFSFSNVTTVAAIPEPSTYAMLLAGLGVVGFLARRRRTD